MGRTHLLRHEWRLLTRSRATWIVAAALGMVMIGAAWTGVQWTAQQRATIARVEAADAQLYASIVRSLDDLARRGDPRPPLALAGMAWYLYQPDGVVAPAPHLDPRRPEAAASEWVGARHAVLPPARGAALAVGQSDLYPFYTRVTIRTRPALVQSDEIENPVNLLSGRFDLAFALTFCWPLLVLPLIYNVLSEEREAGTLALVASQPVSVPRLIIARLVVRVGFALVVTLLTSLAALALFDTSEHGPGWRTSLGWAGAVGATALFWAGLAMVVNVCRVSSAVNATVLASLWVALVVVAPAVIGEFAAARVPVPSRVEMINAIRHAGNLSSSDLTALVSTYYESHPDAIRTGKSADETAIRGLAQQDAVDARIGPILAAHRAAGERQQALVDRLRFLSPPLLVYDGVTELAGTTGSRHRQYAAQVDDYHRQWRAFFYPLVHRRAVMTRQLYAQAPRFHFVEEIDGNRVSRAATLIGCAAGAGLAALAVAWSRLRRRRLLA